MPKIERSATPAIFAIIIAIGGAFIVWFATPFGIGLSPDSVLYLSMARSFQAGEGFLIVNAEGAFAPVTHYPPLYAVVLAMFSFTFSDLFLGARVLHACLFGITALLVVLSSPLKKGGVVAGIVVTLTVTLSQIFSMAWSEALFIPLSLGVALLFSRITTRVDFGYALLCGVCVILLPLTRYVGVAWIGGGGIAFLLFSPTTLRRRVLLAVTFSVVASLGYIGWLLRNLALGKGQTLGRTILFHPEALYDRGQDLLTTFLSWGASTPWADPRLPWAAYVLVGFVVIFLIALPAVRGVKFPSIVWVHLLFGGCYFFLLVLAIIFADPGTFLDYRLLAPIFCSLVIVCGWIFSIAFEGGGFLKRSLILVGLALLFLVRGADALRFGSEISLDGQQYAAKKWKDSSLLRVVEELPEGVMLCSTSPRLIVLYASRASITLPPRLAPGSRLLRDEWSGEMNKLAEEIRAGRMALAYFYDDKTWDQPSLEEIQTETGLRCVQVAKDGCLLGR